MMINVLLEMLDKLKLSDEPYNEAENIIKKLRGYFLVTVHLTSKTVIIRGRNNEGEGHFSTKCELTYPPKSCCYKCGRAAIPNEQMFYACTFENGDIPKSLLVAASEANFSMVPQNRITFGYWRVKRDIELVAILPYENMSDLSPATKILKDIFNYKISQIKQPEERQRSIEIAKYFSRYFSQKVVLGNEYEYIISAEFSRYLIKEEYDGILYPSVQSNGAVLNIALSPQVADTSLDLEGVREYKFVDKTFNLIAFAKLYPGQTHFQLSHNRNLGF